jgi:K+-sensing histidine kinase KdpD
VLDHKNPELLDSRIHSRCGAEWQTPAATELTSSSRFFPRQPCLLSSYEVQDKAIRKPDFSVMDSPPYIKRVLPTAVGLAVCAGCAALAARLFADTSYAGLVPLLFVAVLVILAAIYGTSVGIVGSLVSALIFAYLYAPNNSLQVASHDARQSLGWMVVGGVALSYLLAPGFHDHSRK